MANGPSSSPSRGSDGHKEASKGSGEINKGRRFFIVAAMAALADLKLEPLKNLGGIIGTAEAGEVNLDGTQLAMLNAFNNQIASLPPTIQPTFKEVSEQLSLAVREGLKISGDISGLRQPISRFDNLGEVIYRFNPNDPSQKPTSFEQLSGGKSLQSVINSMRTSLTYNPNLTNQVYGPKGRGLRQELNTEFLNTDFGKLVKNVLFTGRENELSQDGTNETVFDRTISNFSWKWSFMVSRGLLRPDIFERFTKEVEVNIRSLESRGLLNTKTLQLVFSSVGGKVFVESLLVTPKLKLGKVQITYSGPQNTDSDFKKQAIGFFKNNQLPYLTDVARLELLAGKGGGVRELKFDFNGQTFVYLIPVGPENYEKTQIGVNLGTMGDGIVEGKITLELLKRELAESEKKLAESEKKLAESEKKLAEAKEANTILKQVSSFQNMMLSGNFSKLSIIELVSFRGQIEDNLRARKYEPRTRNVCINALNTIIEKLESVSV